jgi:hypothetical protein
MNANFKVSTILVILLIVLLASSCQNMAMYGRLLRVNYGRISEKKLTQYLVKNKIDTSFSYFAANSFYEKIYEPKFQSDSGISLNEFRPIQFRVFDSAGCHINTWANCYGPLAFFAKDVSDLLIKKANKDFILSTHLSDYLELMKWSPTIVASNYDMVIIAYWQWYMVNYSLNMLKQLQSLPNLDINLSSV